MRPPRAVERVLEIVRKEILQVRRDAKLRRLLLVAPLIQLMIFGYAVSTDVRDTPLFVVDHDGTRASRELVEAMTAPGYFRVVGRSERPADLVRALDYGRATVGLEIPPGFGRDLGAGTGSPVQMVSSNSTLTSRSRNGHRKAVRRDRVPGKSRDPARSTSVRTRPTVRTMASGQRLIMAITSTRGPCIDAANPRARVPPLTCRILAPGPPGPPRLARPRPGRCHPAGSFVPQRRRLANAGMLGGVAL